MPAVEDVLAEREGTYGNFMDQSVVTFDLKNVIAQHLAIRKKALAFDQLYALDMFCAKLARIINGNADHIDNWIDIAGYATLVADRLKREEAAARATMQRSPDQPDLPLGEPIIAQMNDIPLTPEQVAALTVGVADV